MIVRRIKSLIFDNKIMNIKIFEENIIDCSEENLRMDAVLKFNGERCYLATDRVEK